MRYLQAQVLPGRLDGLQPYTNIQDRVNKEPILFIYAAFMQSFFSGECFT